MCTRTYTRTRTRMHTRMSAHARAHTCTHMCTHTCTGHRAHQEERSLLQGQLLRGSRGHLRCLFPAPPLLSAHSSGAHDGLGLPAVCEAEPAGHLRQANKVRRVQFALSLLCACSFPLLPSCHLLTPSFFLDACSEREKILGMSVISFITVFFLTR